MDGEVSHIVAPNGFRICYLVNLRTKAVLWMAGASGGRLAQSRLWRPATGDHRSRHGGA